MASTSTLPGRAPTAGQLALAQQIVDGCTRSNLSVTTVPAAVYTDPEHWTREKALIFDRAPQVLCPSALLPQPNMAVPHDQTGKPLLITRDDAGKAHVFITFPWTRGQLKTLTLAALATHVLPFAAGLGANAALRAALPDSPAGHLIEGAAAILLFTPFLLAGHGMAAAAWRRLRPEAAAPQPAAG